MRFEMLEMRPLSRGTELVRANAAVARGTAHQFRPQNERLHDVEKVPAPVPLDFTLISDAACHRQHDASDSRSVNCG